MKMSRVWEMPSSETFSIPAVRKFIYRHINGGKVIIDPFARDSKIGTITNDIDPNTTAKSHTDAILFLKTVPDRSADIILFDPPYSPRQISECYQRLNLTVNIETTQATFWSEIKDEINRIIKPGGIVLSFGWNTNGLGKGRGFEIEEILLVAHGGNHNDTICMAERKMQMTLTS